MEARFYLALGVLALGTAAGLGAGQPQARQSPTDLSLEVAALQTLYDFNFTTEQLKGLIKLAPQTCEEPRRRSRARVSAEYLDVLRKVHAALSNPIDLDELEDVLVAFAELQEKETPDLDDQVEITEEAIEKAPQLLRSLGARQMASFIASYGEDFPDPREMVLQAIGDVRELDEKDWKVLRRTIGQSVGELTAGLGAEKATEVSAAVVEVLIQVRTCSEQKFATGRAGFEAKALKLLEKTGPLDVIRNTAEVALATLLSNPRLEAMAKLRLQNAERAKNKGERLRG